MPVHIDVLWGQLREIALDGDAVAAYELGTALSRCRTYTEIVRSVPVESRRDHLEELLKNDPEAFDRLWSVISNCNTENERLNTAPEWLLRAADAGHERAALHFYDVAMMTYGIGDDATVDWYRSVAVDRLGRVRDTGNVFGAIQIAQITARFDPVAAYANSAVSIAMVEAGRIDATQANPDSVIRLASRLMADSQRTMSPEQVREARRLADEILARCCP